MYLYTTIASENDAIHLKGHTAKDTEKEGYIYKKCTITFWELGEDEDYRTEDSRIKYLLENDHFMVTKLLPQLEKFCDIENFKEFELDDAISEALGVSLVDPYELRDIIHKAIEIGILYSGKDPLNEVNSFFE